MLPRQPHFLINSSTHFLVNPFPRQLVSRQLVIIYIINLSASLLCDDGFSSFEIKKKMFSVELFWCFFLCDG